MELWKFLKSASPEASRLVIYACTALLIKQILNMFPAPISIMYEFGLIIEAILASIIASYIFYLFAIHAKEISDRNVIQPYLDRHIKGILRECETTLKHISNNRQLPLELASLTLENVHTALSGIHGKDKAPLWIGDNEANWIQYLNFRIERTQAHTSRLLAQLPHLKPKEIREIVNIDECHYFFAVQSVIQIDKSSPSRRFNQSLDFFSEHFFSYCMECKQISKNLTLD